MLLARVWKGYEECVWFEHKVRKEGMLGFDYTQYFDDWIVGLHGCDMQ
jgi:hypothetical protein